MNQGRIWCVVHPTVGLPLLIGSVAATSLIVHACVLTHTTWFSAYWNGGTKTKVSMNEPSPTAAGAEVAGSAMKSAPAFVITVAPAIGTAGKTDASFVVTVAPNPAAPGAADADGAAPPTPVASVLQTAKSD